MYAVTCCCAAALSLSWLSSGPVAVCATCGLCCNVGKGCNGALPPTHLLDRFRNVGSVDWKTARPRFSNRCSAQLTERAVWSRQLAPPCVTQGLLHQLVSGCGPGHPDHQARDDRVISQLSQASFINMHLVRDPVRLVPVDATKFGSNHCLLPVRPGSK